MSGRKRELEFKATRHQNHEKGVIERKYSLMRYDVRIPGRAHPWGQVQPMTPTHFENGEVVTMGFLEQRPIPVILTQKPWRSAHPLVREFVGLFLGWRNRGRDKDQNSYLPELDVSTDPDSTVVINGTVPAVKPPGDIVRTFGGRRIVADGNFLREENEADGSLVQGPTDFEGEIIMLSVDSSGRRRSVVEKIASTGPDCSQAESDAFDLASSDVSAFTDGQFACLFGSGDFQQDLDLAFADYLDANPVPPEYVGCEEQWETGLLDGYFLQFLAGYEDEGCVAP